MVSLYVCSSSYNLHYEQIGKEVRCIEDELPFEIPDSWECIRLNNLGIYKKGPFGSALTKSMFVPRSDESIKVYEQKNAIQKNWKLGKYYITKKYYLEKMQSFTVNPGDIIVSCAGTIGETYIMPSDIEIGIINQALMKMTISKNINIDYFLLVFNNIIKTVSTNNSKGSAIKNIPPFSILKQIIVPIPPKEEQKRIVDKINELEPLVEKYKFTEEKLYELNSNIKEQLKKSILQYAIEGKLVPQDSNDEPASILLDRIRKEKQKLIAEGKIKKDKNEPIIYRRDNSYYEKLNYKELCIDAMIPFIIPDSWSWSKLGTCLDVRDGTHDTPRYVIEGVPLVTSKNLSNGQVDFSNAKLISREDSNAINSRSKVDSGDILYAMIGSIGNPVLYQGSDDFSIKNIALFKCIPNGMNMEYVYQFLMLMQEDMKKSASGGVQAFVSLTYLRNYLIPVPPINEQKRICDAIGKTLSFLATL